MKEIVIISGKGGTGKTSITSSFATLAKNCVLADCDVDASDLHLILKPVTKETNQFISGNEAIIDNNKCTQCGHCQSICRFNAIITKEDKYYVDPAMCEGCKVCVQFCPTNAINFPKRNCGEWFISQTKYGTMVHATLAIAAENSGKLVTLVRQHAQTIAKKQNAEYIIVDGPPGTGCPVIASITGADAVLVITEPTLSGIHDLERVVKLAKHFKIPAYVCINKWDINPQNTEIIEKLAVEHNCPAIGRIPYDKEITKAQIAGESIVEYCNQSLTKQITKLWNNLCQKI